MHTAEGTVIDGATVRARASWSETSLSTPTGFTVAMLVSVVAAIVFGVVATRTTIDRRSAADDVVAEAAPLLLEAQALYVALADADAAATTIYLRAGAEAPALRRRYVDAVEQAMDRLAAIAGADLDPGARRAIATIAAQLPRYTGSVEAARANSRQRLPVGAAYQRRASELMRNEILPAATAVYEDAVVALDDRFDDGTRGSAPTAVAVTAGLAVLVVFATHVFVTVRSRRWLNAGLIAAVAVLVASTAAALAGLDRQRAALVEARDEGFALVTSLSAARILTLRTASDENLDLIERGTDDQYIEDFDARSASLGIGRADGLFDIAVAAAPDEVRAGAVRWAERQYADYLAAHDEIRALAEGRQYPQAVEIAVGREAAAAAELDRLLGDLIDRSAATLGDDAEQARALPVPLPIVVAVAALVAVAAIVVGLQPRLREYR